MPTHTRAAATPSKKRGVFADLGSANNATSEGSRNKAGGTGKGTPAARAPTNSRFKQKAALATRSPPLLLAVKRAAGVPTRGSPSRSMLTPGGIKRMRQSAHGSVLGVSRQGAVSTSLAAEPSCDQSISNTSSILSENSTLQLGSVGELSQSFSLGLSLNGRDSLDSARDSIGSARLSTGTFLSGLDAAPDTEQHDVASLLQTKFVDLQNENKALRSQLDSYTVRVSCSDRVSRESPCSEP